MLEQSDIMDPEAPKNLVAEDKFDYLSNIAPATPEANKKADKME